ncbi:unnamed protein product [Mucor hiemalis]
MSSAYIESSHNLLNANNTINEEEEEQQELSSQFTRKCSTIDIHGKSVSNDILVALLDRPGEMKQLVSRNAQFYEAIENYITETQGNFAWQRFQEIIYKPREKLPDRMWINQIGQYLGHNPVFFSKFKETVGYEDDEENYVASPSTVSAQPPPPPHKLTSSTSTGSMNTLGSGGRRRSRRLSAMSLGDILADDDDSIIDEEAPKVPDGMFVNEDLFYQGGRRRRASYHSIQSEPHPTFVDSKIDEVDEAEIEIENRDEDTNGDDSDHLADLLDDDSDEEDDQNTNADRAKDIGAGYSCRQQKGEKNSLDLIQLREYPQFQANLPNSHPHFFRKAKQLLSLAPSSRHFSATIRRNSILEGAMPPSPVTELDEPRFQTCSEVEEDKEGNLVHLICCTRRQQPDDIAWLNGVMESLAGWPELVDRLHDIISESIED